MRLLIALILSLALPAGFAFAQDPTLPDVENLRIEGGTLYWDALDEATGYNIRLNYQYYDTVKGSASYSLSEPGTYAITAFNDAGEYGSDYALRIDYEGGSANDNVEYSFDYITLIVRKTCVNVGPGESCIARCPRSFEPQQYVQAFRPNFMSGGACSTSDIVEADAWVGHKSYHCTVPTFSGEVIAQAICLE